MPGFPSTINELVGTQPGQNTNLPKAAINWIALDEQFKWVSGGFDMVGTAVNTNGTFKNHDLSTIPAIPITKNGYIYVYVSNESQYNVFFDNLQVFHNRGPLLEETHYYPFGLTMNGISSKALSFGSPENKFKYNSSSELQNKEFSDGSGLELYATQFRSLDPQIGRFWQIDPMGMMTPDFSLYTYANNNPVLLNDPTGLLSDSSNPVVLEEVIVRSSKAKAKIAEEVKAFHRGLEKIKKHHETCQCGYGWYYGYGMSAEAYSAILGGRDYPTDEDMASGDEGLAMLMSLIPIERVFAWGGKLIKYVFKIGGRTTTVTKFIGPGLRMAGREGKLIQHAPDWGLMEKGLTPKGKYDEIVNKMKDIVKDVYENANDIRNGAWGNPSSAGYVKDALYYSNGTNVVVTQVDGTFLTVLKNAMGNTNFNNATKIW